MERVGVYATLILWRGYGKGVRGQVQMAEAPNQREAEVPCDLAVPVVALTWARVVSQPQLESARQSVKGGKSGRTAVEQPGSKAFENLLPGMLKILPRGVSRAIVGLLTSGTALVAVILCPIHISLGCTEKPAAGASGRPFLLEEKMH
jgi:hypothetical protein